MAKIVYTKQHKKQVLNETKSNVDKLKSENKLLKITGILLIISLGAAIYVR